MKGKEDNKKPRRPYQKPQVEQVELRPQEAVLGGCKYFDMADYGNASYCHSPSPCYDPGS